MTTENNGRDAFSAYHPVTLFLYFCTVLFFSMFFLHPVLLAISLASVFLYSVLLSGRKAVRFNLLWMLPVTLLIALVNPLLNHSGATILLYVNDNPITLESTVFGLLSAAAFVSVVIGFSCFNVVMTSDKLMYLFGRMIPVLSLMFSMTLRLVPRYKAQIRKISEAQKCIGCDVSQGGIFQRIRNGVHIVSILITWALENAVETADSMKARGFGLKGRTTFSIYSWKRRDKTLLAVQLALLAVVFAGMGMGAFETACFPFVRIAGLSGKSVAFFAAYALFCLLPAIVDGKEYFVWNSLKSAG
ncbi:energy-coupling factor transporter transmembrane component T [Caproiciproducens sp. LBM24188]|nr:energy-coupling factor transporter transmembrane protein EcfT [Clostridiales bacterium]